MVILFRLAAYILAAAIAYVTLGPPTLRPHSNLGQIGEHALAFVLLGVTFALGYPRHRLLAAVLSGLFCGVLELLQLFAPGRHARLEDFLVDALATVGGFAIVSLVDFATRSIRRSSPLSPCEPGATAPQSRPGLLRRSCAASSALYVGR